MTKKKEETTEELMARFVKAADDGTDMVEIYSTASRIIARQTVAEKTISEAKDGWKLFDGYLNRIERHNYKKTSETPKSRKYQAVSLMAQEWHEEEEDEEDDNE